VNGGGRPRGITFSNYPFIHHRLYLGLHFLSQCETISIWGSPKWLHITYKYMMFYDIRSRKIVSFLIMKYISVFPKYGPNYLPLLLNDPVYPVITSDIVPHFPCSWGARSAHLCQAYVSRLFRLLETQILLRLCLMPLL